eukprot:g12703.t1
MANYKVYVEAGSIANNNKHMIRNYLKQHVISNDAILLDALCKQLDDLGVKTIDDLKNINEKDVDAFNLNKMTKKKMMKLIEENNNKNHDNKKNNQATTKYDLVLEYYNKSLDMKINTLGKNDTEIAGIYNNIAAIYDSQNKYDEALEYMYKSLEIYINQLGKDHPDIVDIYNTIGNLYYNQSKYHEALTCYHDSYYILKKEFGEDHPKTKRTFNDVQRCKNKKK